MEVLSRVNPFSTTRRSNGHSCWWNGRSCRLYAGTSRLSPDKLRRGWIYSIADVVATLQLGLVQWVRGDAIVVMKPSNKARRKYLTLQNHWLRGTGQYNCRWGPRLPAPAVPVDKPVCTFETVVACPAVCCSSRKPNCGRPGSTPDRVTGGHHQRRRRRRVGPRSRRCRPVRRNKSIWAAARAAEAAVPR